jgi:lipopolysaccharide export system permease protein
MSNSRISNEIAIGRDKEQKKSLRQHKIEWHRKIALSLACLVLFLIGAPLGSIIRKGGLGSPLIFAIVFFMVFYFSSTTGEKFAKEGSMSPFTGMWLSTFILLPMGFFLIYKAMRDSQLFNKEYYYRIWKKLPLRRKPR